MTLRHLMIFICVCDAQNMTKAAEQMYMTQPSVSQAVGELEKYYQVRLFERLGRNLFITPAGRQLLTYARHIVNLHKQTEEAMREFGAKYRVRMGASITIGSCFLIDLIKILRWQHPDSEITSIIYNTTILERMLLRDELDLALVEGRLKSEYIIADPFLEDELIFVAAPGHPLAQKGRIAVTDLCDVDFFVREEGSGTRELFDYTMIGKGVQWKMAGAYNNAESIKKAVAAGLGITVISRQAVKKELKSGELRQIDVAGLSFKRKFHIAYHKNKYLSPELLELMDLCRQLAETLHE